MFRTPGANSSTEMTVAECQSFTPPWSISWILKATFFPSTETNLGFEEEEEDDDDDEGSFVSVLVSFSVAVAIATRRRSELL